ncbi:NADH-quinone oxidoreductase subunit N [Neomoorella thermoacetica]|uniref:NADH-quinone oxidoreductase subunit N n=3 Tax=Neomoorella thermoacetica TaxID=1525 RepID=NUON_MOOTA|nr:NADH-quinone oxidoreductase subunit N [Moorella thermoacetica]Q2RJT7.1 RecName: Full=NADH-quinone oxidoreductase subunit N; AltName: Full=NADH dehydrogenase I subunit N; AltName: Full=NDH-1 subunit N [Moorella thermoacetica ATCC 39073]AKX93746.1 NADH-quinone oxidoreductase subunit N [Moorella thermoacetica]AKX96388.1 NADH-quinone oxidoreductase subunit N [Moorella thermoacetica]AOQ23668.1 NADH-quinone oxidoreductase subunit N [Moorella thermoacetica]APC08105.1 NADH-quinone oxidoreductase su
MANLHLLTVEILTAALGLGLLALGLLVPHSDRRGIAYVATAGLAGILAAAFGMREASGVVLGGYVIDPFGTYFKILFLVAAMLTAACSYDYVEKMGLNQGEYYALLVLATLGMMVLASSGELVSLYLGLELMTITFCILAAFHLGDAKSAEAGIKYVLLGAMSSAIFLYGLSLVYGSSGTTVIREIGQAVATRGASPALLLGTIFILAGFAFKVTAVPFHMWSPDVYEGAPTPVTGFLSVASKAAAFAALVRVFFGALPDLHSFWVQLFIALAVLTIVLGNLVAIPQTNIKRLLAYSSIAQAGYLLLGIVSFSVLGVGAVMYYAMLYVFGNMGAFMAATAFYNNDGSDEIKDYAGLARRSPLVAALMLFSLLSLAGIPPMAGFVGKFYLFMSIISRQYIWLAILGILMSMVSVYYYLLVAKAMYLGNPPEGSKPLRVAPGLQVAMVVSLLILFILGIYPTPLTNYAMNSAVTFFMP